MIETGNIVIPIEILTKIFELLPQKEQINLRSVCKAFKMVFDDGFYLKGFRFTVKENGYDNNGDEDDAEENEHAKLAVIYDFKIREICFKSLENIYNLEELSFLDPEAVKILKLKGSMNTSNFSMLMDQLTNLSELYFSGDIFKNLTHFHLANLKFESLKVLHISQFSINTMMEEIQVFLIENEFSKLKIFKLKINQKRPNGTNLKKITAYDLPQGFKKMQDKILKFLKNCQKTIMSIILQPINFFYFGRSISEIEENEDSKIYCPNLKFVEFNKTMNIKINPWLAFLDKNFENLQSFVWIGEDYITEYKGIQNLLMTKNAPILENLKWISTAALGDVDFEILRGFQVLKFLEFDLSSFGIENTFKNLRLISHFCSKLETLIIGKGYIDSDSIDYLLTGKNLPELKNVKLESEWKIGNGVSVDTYKNVIEEKKIKELWLTDCVNNESFTDPVNREYLISKIGFTNFDKLLSQIVENQINKLVFIRFKNHYDFYTSNYYVQYDSLDSEFDDEE